MALKVRQEMSDSDRNNSSESEELIPASSQTLIVPSTAPASQTNETKLFSQNTMLKTNPSE